MPTRDDHLRRAEQNETFARSLNLDENFNVDWAITLLFYSALHYIDAYFAQKSFHPPNHLGRDAAIGNNPVLDFIYRDYRRLKHRSEKARYEIANFHRSQFPSADQRFQRVKDHVLSKLR